MSAPVTYLTDGIGSHCYGCGGCAGACPVGCITMAPGADGFLFPSVDRTACVNCGRCVAVCPHAHPPAQSRPVSLTAAVNADPDTVQRSSSGGVFTALAEAVLARGGVVFGAAWQPGHRCAHQAAYTVEELPPLLKSKYVQSEVGDTYARAKALLAEGRPVLYSGTPCQIAGLRAFLGREEPQLFCVDVACHGVPSGADLTCCVRALEETYHAPVAQVDFRNKALSGWQHGVTVTFEKGKSVTFAPYQLPYYYYFLYSRNIRESCYTCRYAGLARVGDITLADFWRIERVFPDFPASRGASAVLCNTPKGVELFGEVAARFTLRPVTDDGVLVAYNQPFREPCSRYARREELLTDVLQKGYNRAHSHISVTERVKGACKAALSAGMKRKLSRLLRRT